MRRLALAVGVLLLTAGGCLKTYRYEHSEVVNAGLNGDGSCTVSRHGEGEGRQWCGPWLAPPCRAQP